MSLIGHVVTTNKRIAINSRLLCSFSFRINVIHPIARFRYIDLESERSVLYRQPHTREFFYTLSIVSQDLQEKRDKRE